ncbi:carboxymuconolactone decarboxylase family protein [Paucibacter sp. R3-3]|uniref:Carboxymuconolactone decarboxylase family protein n=1 Tax=Roseateles agri TaxID=3098619 RepID=A0ABU5DT86_9BURK|nr:carboxymuconolactone decarboxylase family protein [Paucibacter sp. R3-3]MDY0749086.1 carboxymuconolactone decarboxylase family protein [Paucibacter sp. R3-3]
MQTRLDFREASPEAVKALIALEVASSSLGLDADLLNLIKLRASQVNGCAFCIDLHSADLRKSSEGERRIAGTVAWRETPFFSDRERAALAWTEAVTLVASTHVPDDVYLEVSKHFEPAELVELTLAISTINAWNRMAVSFRKMPAA